MESTYTFTWDGRSRMVAIRKDGQLVNRVGAGSAGREQAMRNAEAWVAAQAPTSCPYCAPDEPCALHTP